MPKKFDERTVEGSKGDDSYLEACVGVVLASSVGNLKARLHGDGIEAYWELLCDGVRVGTFTLREIAGIHATRARVIKFVTSLNFGKLLIQSGCVTKESTGILKILWKAVVTAEEEGLNG